MRILFGITPVWLCVLTAFFIATGLNLGFWQNVYAIRTAGNSLSLPVMLSAPIVLTLALNLLLLPFSQRKIIKPAFVFIILTSALFNYAMFHYGVVFDNNMFTNIVQTDASESLSYFNLSFVAEITLLGILPAGLVLAAPLEIMTRRKAFWQTCLSAFFSIIVIGGIGITNFDDYATIGRNNRVLSKTINPVSPYKQAYKYIHEKYFRKDIPYRTLAADITRGTAARSPRLTVMVLGETQRGMNYSLNGYPRATNAYTEKMGLVSFQNVHAYGTATAISVPYIFSLLPRDYDAEREPRQDNIIDALVKADIDTIWLDNDGGCKGVCKNSTFRNLRSEYAENKDLCPYKDSCYDAIFIDAFDKLLQAPIEKDTLIVLHLMGSHGPSYWQRYPKDFGVFSPVCPNSDIQNCEREALVNTYDNTILYSDYVISRIIQIIQNRQSDTDSSMIFMSDHGESLGEKGLYLHGMPKSFAPIEQKQVPFLVWMSDALRKSQDIDQACLTQEAAGRVIEDANIAGTLMGLFDVSTSLYAPKDDYLAPCRRGQRH